MHARTRVHRRLLMIFHREGNIVNPTNTNRMVARARAFAPMYARQRVIRARLREIARALSCVHDRWIAESTLTSDERSDERRAFA